MLACMLLTNHARVLLCLSRDDSMRMRDVAAALSLTERAVQRIVAELEASGALRRTREGRRNRYEIGVLPLAEIQALSQLVPDVRVRASDGIARNQSFID